MDTLSAFAMGQANQGRPLMVFDWDEAARRIPDSHAHEASAGLRNDWDWTGGPICRDGEPVPADDTYTYLASTWAVPELDIDGDVSACWRYENESPGWDARTYWPESARAILTRVDGGVQS